MNWPRSMADFEFIENSSLNIVDIKNSNDFQKEFYEYSRQFNIAGNELVEHMINTAEIHKLDMWFFAVVYLYRQCLELILKSIAFQYISDEHHRKSFITIVRHNLKDCFDEITNLNGEVFDKSKEEIEWLYNYLTDISKIDAQSDLFRYPFNNKLESYFNKQTHINLIALYENMNTAYNILTHALNNDVLEIATISNEPKLIIEGGEYYGQSVVGWKSRSLDFYPYIQGYIESANHLYDVIVGNNAKKELFLPMCYLYRNGIELSLKRILMEDCKININQAAKIIRKKKHSILGLWNSIQDEISKNSNAPDDDKTLQNVEIYINQLHVLDQTSDKFRYPIDKNLKFHFQNRKQFDITNVSLCFKELFTFLDAVDSMLSHIREYEADMAAEMMDNYYDYY